MELAFYSRKKKKKKQAKTAETLSRIKAQKSAISEDVLVQVNDGIIYIFNAIIIKRQRQPHAPHIFSNSIEQNSLGHYRNDTENTHISAAFRLCSIVYAIFQECPGPICERWFNGISSNG